jgi:glycosyltransferase involved in cell wall biosynthesis
MVSEREPFFSILVPTRNRPDHVAACVAGVVALDHPSFELLVCDQSDDDRTRLAAGSAAGGDGRVRVIRVEGRGRSRALNGGIPHARGRWVVFLDDDCEPVPGWLAELEREALACPPRSAVLGRVLAGPAEAGLAPPPATIEDPEPRDYRGRVDRDLIYPNFALPRAALEEIGPFDERMGVGTSIPGGEDNDFGYRLLQAGWTIAYRPGPAVIHRAWRTHAARRSLKYAYGVGQGAFYAKYLLRGDGFVAWRCLRDVVRNGRHLAGALVRLRAAEAGGHLRYLAGLPVGMARLGRLAARTRETA